MKFSNFKKFLRYAWWTGWTGLFGLALAIVLSRGVELSSRFFSSRNLAVVYQGVGTIALPQLSPTLGRVEEARAKIDPYRAAIPANGRAVLANLDEMTIGLYENGLEVTSVPIISKGKPGSPWETPPGQYQVLGREENHFSSIGEVFMPHSLQFFGNYFIHGWPYYPNGEPVAPSYSGGCLRLASDDAKKVFDFTAVGTPIIIERSPVSATAGHYAFRSDAKPELSAKSFLVADVETGEVVLERERETARPIASITKLFSALVSLEAVNQFRPVAVSERAVASYGEAGNLTAGEIITTGDLLYPLLLESSNDAAEALAEFIGRERFVDLLNKKAVALGLFHTTLTDPSGIEASNVSTASDLFRLFQYLYRSKSYILKTLLKPSYTLAPHEWRNNSEFLARSGYLGGKSGHTTAATDTFLAGFKVKLGAEERPLVLVLLGSDNRVVDTLAILKYLEENVIYEREATSLVFVGDLMLDRGVKGALERGGHSFADLFKETDLLATADLAFGNLEGPLSDQGQDIGNLYSFRMSPEALPALRGAGFDVLSFANNHVGDYGREAFLDTIARLREAALFPVGAGENAEVARIPAVIERDGQKFGFLGASDVGPDWLGAESEEAGILLASDPDFPQIIRDAAKNVDFLIVSFHFGEEYQTKPSPRQVALAHAAIDAGAKLVIGHHPHVVQPVEQYGGGLIAYSLGNFIFDQSFSAETKRGLALEVLAKDGQIVGFQEHPVEIGDDFRPHILQK